MQTEKRIVNDTLTERIIGAAIQVHRELGPGLLESTYETCLCHELSIIGLKHERQKSIPIFYKGVKLDAGYHLDLVVENTVIIEIKSISELLPIHEAQLLSYLYRKCFKNWEFSKDFSLIFARRSRRSKKVLYCT